MAQAILAPILAELGGWLAQAGYTGEEIASMEPAEAADYAAACAVIRLLRDDGIDGVAVELFRPQFRDLLFEAMGPQSQGLTFQQATIAEIQEADSDTQQHLTIYCQRVGERMIARGPEVEQKQTAWALRLLLDTVGPPLCDLPLADDRPEPEPATCPALPPGALLDPDIGRGCGEWLDLYTAYAASKSPMTPADFHLSAALWLLAVGVARRLRLPMAFGDVHTNLFIVWIAPTTLFRKSTALNFARDLARRAFPHLLAPQEATPESFLSDMAGREPAYMEASPEWAKDSWHDSRDFAAQKGIVLDEISGLFAASGRDYNAGLIESLLRFYDADPWYVRSTRGQGQVIVRNSYLSLLGATTPMALSPHLKSERLWSMGLWPRCAILMPNCDRPTWQEPRVTDEPPTLMAGIHQLYERLPKPTWPDPPEALAVSFSADAHKAWNRYNRALSYDMLTPELNGRLYGTYGRLPVQALKIAALLAALDWPGHPPAPRIQLPHLARAMSISETWRESAHRVLDMVNRTEFDRLQQRITRLLATGGPDGATIRDMHQHMRDLDPGEIENTVLTMVRLGTVAAQAWQNPRGGPKTTKYRLATE